jgi:preprotein translocase SecE subunit
VAEEPATSKRRLKKTETVREKAEKAVANSSKEPRRLQEKTRKLRAPLKAAGRPFRFIGRFLVPRYFRNSWRELRQVTWPKFGESLRLTFAVFVFGAVFTILVAVLDLGLDKVFKEVFLQ